MSKIFQSRRTDIQLRHLVVFSDGFSNTDVVSFSFLYMSFGRLSLALDGNPLIGVGWWRV